MSPKILLLAIVVAAIPVVGVRADLIDNLTIDIRLGRRTPPPPPAVVVVVPDNDRRGPDQWEQHHRWYQRSQAYYYYPGDNVYYRQSDRVWFYLDRGQWRSGRNLPEYVRIDLNRSVILTMFTDQPYTYHSQVTARYPSNYFGTRVRLRDDDRHEDRHDNRKRDNDHDGRDKDHDGRDQDKDRDNRK